MGIRVTNDSRGVNNAEKVNAVLARVERALKAFPFDTDLLKDEEKETIRRAFLCVQMAIAVRGCGVPFRMGEELAESMTDEEEDGNPFEEHERLLEELTGVKA